MLMASLIFLFVSVHAQTKTTTTGRVTDQQGQPVPFVTIQVKGTKAATSADADGYFSLKVKDGDVLVISGAGFESKTVTVSGGTVNVQVSRKESNMAEVVVTGALGVQRQAKSLGYSTAKITGGDLTQAKPISAVNGLTGKVSGLQINTVNNGVFAPTRVTLRGNRSLTGNNQPLYVVDGAIFYNDISTLNPDDIIDITVLKGSSASAVYGSDASNGVIVVTTKKGTRGKPVITVASTVQQERVAYMPDYQTRFGSNGGEKWVNDFNNLNDAIPYENQAYGPEFRPGAMVPIGRPIFDGTYQYIPYSAIKNQKRDFFDNAITTQNSFSYSAGDENSRFFVSAQDVNTKGVMPGDKGRRDVFRLGGSRTSGIFSADFNLSYTNKKTDLTSQPATVYDQLIQTPADIPISRYKNWATDKYSTLDGYYNDYYTNPYWTLANDRSVTQDNNLEGNVHLALKPTSWLNFSYRLSANYLGRTNDISNAGETYSVFASKHSDSVYYSNYAGNGIVRVDESPKYNASLGNTLPTYATATFSNFLITQDFLATFNKNLTQDFNLTATAGITYLDNQIKGSLINAGTLFFPVYNVSSLTGIPGVASAREEARKLGYFGEATVGYKGFAFVHGSYRTDIDSRLSKDNRYIPYYDVDGSLVISDLIPSIGRSDGLNYIQVRAAHSLTGNVSALAQGSPYIADGAYATDATLVSSSGLGFPYNGVGGYALNGTIANPNIKPEKVTENEVGLELGYKNILALKAAVYEQKLKDGIVYTQIPTSSGFNKALVNAASTDNKGLELELQATVIHTKDWGWKVGVNYTHTQSKVLAINGNQQSLTISQSVNPFLFAGQNNGSNANSFAVVGHAYPVIETYDWVRDGAGRVIVDAVSGTPTKSSSLSILGNANPTDILGVTTNVTWKRFSLSATADYRGGHKIFNWIGNAMDFSGVGSTTAATGRQRFVFPNSVIIVNGKSVPNTNVTVSDANFNFWPSVYNSVGANYVVSAAAWKLREVTISYDIPKTIFAATRIIQKAQLIVSGRNLIMIRPSTNKWTDPEFNEGTGNDVGRTGEAQAPPTRIFSATLSLTF
ncbi:SusC/RagA family TonB-linked outer membrane protein [Puia dinghuensis]|uniref:SusC/RagA family TonB-linked outer membrane protein n=2 Tax=Puia dinghuensis TaxID=1792502 RepID=A0A8J2XU36_9BACT|nr:SusC/RagA family TonB-linked outer membrane protein [Puia dinghuensis]